MSSKPTSLRETLKRLHDQIRDHSGSPQKLQQLEKQLIETFNAAHEAEQLQMRERSSRAARLIKLTQDKQLQPREKRLLFEMAELVKTVPSEDLDFATRSARDQYKTQLQ